MAGAAVYIAEVLESRMLLSGTWTPLTNAAPGSVQTMLLLPNGSVMTSSGGFAWDLLTPDSSGSYVNGTWTRLADSNAGHFAFASQVLPDGRVLVAGDASLSTGSETYDPLTNVWTPLPTPDPGKDGFMAYFGEPESTMLPDGRVMLSPQLSKLPDVNGQPVYPHTTVIFDPTTSRWSEGPALTDWNNNENASEATWVRLRDDTVLLTPSNMDPIDFSTTSVSELFTPLSNPPAWKHIPGPEDAAGNEIAGSVPARLLDPLEEGAATVLSDGRAFFVGGTGQTAIYTPGYMLPGSPALGTWVPGPSFPTGLGADDAPLAMLPDGTVLMAAGPRSGSSSSPTFLLYNPAADPDSQIVSLSPPLGESLVPAQDRMLDLPNGQVLFSDSSSQAYVYSPGTAALTIATPSITSIVNNADGSLTLTGTGLNGIDAGAAYGDDAQMDTNYPIISLTSGTNVYYATTSGWSTTYGWTDGGPSEQKVNFRLPRGIPAGTYSVTTSANGVSSTTPVSLTISTTPNNSAPTIATAAAAVPAEVTGTTTNLSVQGEDDGGESNLVYTWTTASAPAGAPLPSFSINGTNAAKNTTVTFHHAGNYTFDVIATDAGGLSTGSSVNVNVVDAVTQVTVAPAVATLNDFSGAQATFTAQAFNRFGLDPLAPLPIWSVSGGGMISTTGAYQPPGWETRATVQATIGGINGTAYADVLPYPWNSIDIGLPSQLGSGYQDSNGVFQVQGSGSGIGSTSDSFQFVNEPLIGDGIVTAHVASQQDTASSAVAGVMIRELATEVGSSVPYVLMATTPGNGAVLQDRTTQDGSTNTLPMDGAGSWVRLVRSGDTITGYLSSDGVNWTKHGSVTAIMDSSRDSTVYVGLAVCSADNSVLNASAFDNVSVVEAPSNFGFETPSYGTGAPPKYNPAGASWTFAGSSGIAANGSSITADNPAAPEGSQVAFLEGANAAISQQVSLPDGADEITFSAAQRAGNPAAQNFQVLLDGNLVAQITPAGTAYATYVTNPFVVSAGTQHTIEFVSLDSAGGDNYALIDNVIFKSASTVTALALTGGANPSNATQSLKFTATVLDDLNSLGVPNGDTVSLEDHSNNDAVVATGTTYDDSAIITVPPGALLAGPHDLIAVYNGDGTYAPSQPGESPHVSQTVQVVVTSVVVNGDNPNGLYTAAGQPGNGVQRSMVEDVVYSFSEPVNIADASAAFTVTLAGQMTGTLPSTLIATPVPGSNNMQWAVSLTGQADGVLASIANGEYSIAINPAYIHSIANTSIALAQGRTDYFYRLFGDINGDEVVNAGDNAQFKTALVTYNAAFDSNGDGFVNALDNARFKQSMSITFAGDGFTPTI